METSSKVKDLEFVIIVNTESHYKLKKKVFRLKVCYFAFSFTFFLHHTLPKRAGGESNSKLQVSFPNMCAYDSASGSSLLLTLLREVFQEASEALVRFMSLPRDVFGIYPKAPCVMKGECNALQYDAGVPELCGSNWVGQEDKNNF